MATPTTPFRKQLPVNEKILHHYFAYGEEMLCLSSSAMVETPSVRYESKIKTIVEKSFLAIDPRVIFTSRPLLPAIKKNVLPASVYNFSCHCGSRYIGRISQRLQDRIFQHVSKFIRIGQIPNSRNTFTRVGKSSKPVMFSESAIGQQFLHNPMCAKNYSDRKFTILSFGLSSFH